MTYLAVQMSLYLVSAALIGIGLGWLVWGRSQHRHIAKLHTEMTTALEAERSLSDEARRDLQKAEAKLDRALESEKANTTKTVDAVRQLLDAEKEATHAARTEADRLRLDMDTAINEEKTSAANTINEAMQHAEGFKAALDEAMTRETQIRAELEELRLMAGAEKLAAQSARSEVEQMRFSMQASLDAERKTSAEAREALDDIRATLARTFGGGAGALAALDTQSETPASETAGMSDSMETGVQEVDGDDPAEVIEEFDDIVKPTAFSKPITIPGIDSEPGIAFDVPDEPVTAINERAQSDDLTDPVDSDRDDDDQASLDSEDPKHPDPDSDTASQPVQLHPSTAIEDQPTESDAVAKPRSFYDERPDEVDSLQEIGGIDEDIERLLNDHGCYHFKQLAHFSSEDIDWLTRTIASVPDLKERIEHDGWVEQARELQVKKYMATNAERPRWWSRRRLQ